MSSRRDGSHRKRAVGHADMRLESDVWLSFAPIAATISKSSRRLQSGAASARGHVIGPVGGQQRIVRWSKAGASSKTGHERTAQRCTSVGTKTGNPGICSGPITYGTSITRMIPCGMESTFTTRTATYSTTIRRTSKNFQSLTISACMRGRSHSKTGLVGCGLITRPIRANSERARQNSVRFAAMSSIDHRPLLKSPVRMSAPANGRRGYEQTNVNHGFGPGASFRTGIRPLLRPLKG